MVVAVKEAEIEDGSAELYVFEPVTIMVAVAKIRSSPTSESLLHGYTT